MVKHDRVRVSTEVETAAAASFPSSSNPTAPPMLTSLGTLRDWAEAGVGYSMFTCYDATTARWLYRAGVRILLVGDSAAQLVLGLPPSQRATIDFMAAIGAAVKRGAPNAFVVVDYPEDLIGPMEDHARLVRRLAADTNADAIKVEGDAESLSALLASPALESVAVVAHLTPEPQAVRGCSGQGAPGRDENADSPLFVGGAIGVAKAGACAVVLAAVAPGTAARVVDALRLDFPSLPVFGCHCADACPGRVEMLHEVLGLRGEGASDGVGHAILEAVRRRLGSRRSSDQSQV